MIPGSYAFRGAMGSLLIMGAAAGSPASLVGETMALAVRTVLLVVAIAVGLALPFALPLPRQGRKAPQ